MYTDRKYQKMLLSIDQQLSVVSLLRKFMHNKIFFKTQLNSATKMSKIIKKHLFKNQ